MVYVVGVCRETTHIFLGKVPDAPELHRSQYQQSQTASSNAAGLPLLLILLLPLVKDSRLMRMCRALL